MSGGEIARAIREAGVVGAGGAGFPTHVKAQSRVSLVIANGAECEPLLATDKSIMANMADEVLSGLRLMMEATGAARGVVTTKAHYRECIAALRPLAAGKKGMELFLLDDFYPSGDEHVLVHEVTGRVVPEGGIPLAVDVVVNNVATLTWVHHAMQGRPVTRKSLTVTGSVACPGIYRAPVGTRIDRVLEAAGGPTCSSWAVVNGGPMMGPLTEPGLPMTKTTSGLIVLPTDHPLVRSRLRLSTIHNKMTLAACCQCRACTDLCPRYLLGHELEPNKYMRTVMHSSESRASEVTQAFLCSQCNVCEAYACPMGLSPRFMMGEGMAKLRSDGVKSPHHKSPERARRAQGWTRVPVSRLKARLGLARVATPPPGVPVPVETDRVEILLKQHIGAPARAVVSSGQSVREGDLVGEIPEGAMGARVHASIDGVVRLVDQGRVVIER